MCLCELLDIAMNSSRSAVEVEIASMHVGLLIERERYGSRCDGLVDDSLLAYHPTDSEIRQAIGRIVAFAAEIRVQHAWLVHALARSRDKGVVDALLLILERSWGEADREIVALNCVRGISLLGAEHEKDVMRHAASSQWASVRDFASKTLARCSETNLPKT